mgnify:CR=1 FL=1|jgi:hypothetical protein|tara:strand:+ start:532 stop:1095 length:564 start_codon:yes stop_codon:yes gene_type:complete
MSGVVDFVFNNLSRIGQDNTNFTQDNLMNKSQLNYNTVNFGELSDKNAIEVAASHPTMIMKGGNQLAPSGQNVNESSNLMKSKMTNLNYKISLQERSFKTVPYLGRGNADVGLENNIRIGDSLKDKKSVSQLNESCQFEVDKYPLQGNLKKNITNSKHLIEESAVDGWIRGGLPSREIYKDEKYESN